MRDMDQFKSNTFIVSILVGKSDVFGYLVNCKQSKDQVMELLLTV